MSKLDLQFAGVITNVSPIHIVPPNSPMAKTADGRGEAAEVATLPIMIDNQIVRVPVIPASTIRGKLRRAATAVALSHLDAKPSLEAWLYATIGGVKGSAKEDAFDIVDRNSRRRHHPITGLFGASAPWDPSHAYISPAIPQERVSAEFVNGVRSDDFTRKAEIVSMLDDQGIPDYLAIRKGTKDRTAAA